MDDGLAAAIKAVGGKAATIAKGIGLTEQAISAWWRVPFHRVHDVERFTGVPRHVLRPDYWSPPEPSKDENSTVSESVPC